MPQKIRRLVVGAIGLPLAAAMAGCVSAEQYAGQKMRADQLAEQLAHAQTDINTANARADAAERQLQNLNNSRNASDALTANAQQQAEELRKQNEDWSRKYADAMAQVGRAGAANALPTPLSNELSDFASKNPDVIDFDAAHGVVKFKSDVTFPAGDATVTASAKSVLAKFATILNSAAAEHYELLVAGHTDSTPVTNPTTIKKGNFDNWYLSSHRAITVSKELIADGVTPKRLGVVGYADERPVASNATEAGKAQNRRVEVLILPTTTRSSGGSSPVTPSRSRRSTHAAPAAPVESAPKLNKDGGGAAAAPAPVMNK